MLPSLQLVMDSWIEFNILPWNWILLRVYHRKPGRWTPLEGMCFLENFRRDNWELLKHVRPVFLPNLIFKLLESLRLDRAYFFRGRKLRILRTTLMVTDSSLSACWNIYILSEFNSLQNFIHKLKKCWLVRPWFFLKLVFWYWVRCHFSRAHNLEPSLSIRKVGVPRVPG